MPEIDDKIRLYFPTEKEQDAYAASAYHEGGTGLRNMPEKKFWRNKEGKEIQLAPEKILLTNNNGTYIELSDANGVEIVSNGSVTLSAGGMLSISSRNSTIELSAPKRVKLKQGDTMMERGGDLNLSGAQIKLQQFWKGMEINMEIKIVNGIFMESNLPFLGVESFEFEWKPNEHAFLTMRGYLNEKEKYHLAEAYGDKIKLKLEEGGVTLFHGYVVDIRVDHVGNFSEIKLKAASR